MNNGCVYIYTFVHSILYTHICICIIYTHVDVYICMYVEKKVYLNSFVINTKVKETNDQPQRGRMENKNGVEICDWIQR